MPHVAYPAGKSLPWRLQGHLEETPLIFLHSQFQFLLDLGSIFNDFCMDLGYDFPDFPDLALIGVVTLLISMIWHRFGL